MKNKVQAVITNFGSGVQDLIKPNITERQLNLLAYFYDCDHYFSYGYDTMQDWTYLDRKTLQQDIKALRGFGLIDYVRGLMDEEGLTAGSGFQIRYEKLSYIKSLLNK